MAGVAIVFDSCDPAEFSLPSANEVEAADAEDEAEDRPRFRWLAKRELSKQIKNSTVVQTARARVPDSGSPAEVHNGCCEAARILINHCSTVTGEMPDTLEELGNICQSESQQGAFILLERLLRARASDSQLAVDVEGASTLDEPVGGDGGWNGAGVSRWHC